MPESIGMRTLRRFATECRKLAHECAEGTAPRLIRGNFDDGFGNHCAAGEALSRSVDNGSAWDAFGLIDELIPRSDPFRTQACRLMSSTILFEANNNATDRDRHSAVVFPLLYAADCAEDLLKKLARK